MEGLEQLLGPLLAAGDCSVRAKPSLLEGTGGEGLVFFGVLGSWCEVLTTRSPSLEKAETRRRQRDVGPRGHGRPWMVHFVSERCCFEWFEFDHLLQKLATI